MTARAASDQPFRAAAAPDRLGLSGLGLLVAFGYAVLLGGSIIGELHPALRATTTLIGAAVVGTYLVRAPHRADRLDIAALGAVILLAAAGLMSEYPRQSLDAMLAGLLYAAAFFVARGALARAPVRRTFVGLVMMLSAFITLLLGISWIPPYLELWALTDWSVMPRLDLPFGGGPWGHRYDAALLIILLYPAWWVGRLTPLRIALAVVTGIVGVSIVLLTGSRTAWLALAVGVLAVGVPHVLRLARRRPRVAVGASVAAAGAGAALFGLGILAPLLERLVSFASASWRLAMWEPLTELWASHPIAGVGPGSFPWALQRTDYFDTNAHAPRHPDSVLFQLLPELGLLGVGAVVLLLAVLMPVVIRSRSGPALWTVAVWFVASIGTNPTDYAFLILPALAWVAYALPHRSDSVQANQPAPRAPTALKAVAGILILASVSVTHIGSFAYEAARSAVANVRPGEAIDSLRLAHATDPSLALYARQLGALQLLESDIEAARASLVRATTLNPTDDAAWRSLALTHTMVGDDDAAAAAVEQAVDVKRSEPLNLMMQAWLATEGGRRDDAVEALAEIVQTWPSIVAAPGWSALLPPETTTADIVDAAVTRWVAGAPMPALVSDQALWLAAMSGDPTLLSEVLEEPPLPEPELHGYLWMLGCQADPRPLLESPTAAEQRGHIYWSVRLRYDQEPGEVDAEALRWLTLVGGNSFSPTPLALSPLNEGLGWSTDQWGYRRISIVLPAGDLTFPVHQLGAGGWLGDPAGMARSLGLGDRLEGCVVHQHPGRGRGLLATP